MLWFLKYFRQQIGVLAQTAVVFLQKFDHNSGFWEKRQFFAENFQKSRKIVIIISTTGVDFMNQFRYGIYGQKLIWANIKYSFLWLSVLLNLRI
jgi:hypothetical protein